MCSEVWQIHCTVCNYTLIYAYLNGIYQGMGSDFNNEWYSVSTPMNFQTILLCKKVTNWYRFSVKKILQVSSNKLWFWCCNGRFTFKLQNFKKVKLIFGHPVHISSRHSNVNFAHYFVIYWLFQNGANKNQHQNSYQREIIPDKFIFFQNW